MSEKISVFLVDDHQMFLDGLSMILSSNEIIGNIQTFNSPYSALAALEYHTPDVFITDLNMPEMDGIELTLTVKDKHPSTKVLILSMHNDQKTVAQIVEAEAEGYVLKTANKSEIIKAISTVAGGGTFYSNEIVTIMLKKYQEKDRISIAEQLLTEREKEILTLIAKEYTNDQIGDILFISPRTVETHRKNMMSKTKSNSLISLLKFGIKNELISLQ
jgi:two-component system, NarL family, nitrate/nitrite response regulator NarL